MEQSSTLFSLSIEPRTKSHLENIAKWAKFLSLAGMVLLAFAVVGSFMSISIISKTRPYIESQQEQEVLQSVRIGTIIGALIIILISFFPLLFLLRFSAQLKRALAGDNQEALNLAFQNLKRYFRYLGIMLIVIIAIYGVSLLATFAFREN
jgi:amino acid transporter